MRIDSGSIPTTDRSRKLQSNSDNSRSRFIIQDLGQDWAIATWKVDMSSPSVYFKCEVLILLILCQTGGYTKIKPCGVASIEVHMTVYPIF